MKTWKLAALVAVGIALVASIVWASGVAAPFQSAGGIQSVPQASWGGTDGGTGYYIKPDAGMVYHAPNGVETTLGAGGGGTAVAPTLLGVNQLSAYFGETIDVWTSNTSAVAAVIVGGTSISFTAVSSTHLTFVAPSTASQGPLVLLFTGGGQVVASPAFTVYDPTVLTMSLAPGAQNTDPRLFDAQNGTIQINPYGVAAYTYTSLINTSYMSVAASIDWTMRLAPWPANTSFANFYFWSSLGGSSDGFAELRVNSSGQFIAGVRGVETHAIASPAQHVEQGDEIEARYVCEPGLSQFFQQRVNGVWEATYNTGYGGDSGSNFNPPFNLNAFVLGGLPPWTASTAVATGARYSNAGNVYLASSGGTTGSSGGPTGTSGSISDGSVTWAYQQTGAGASPAPVTYFSAVAHAWTPAPEFVAFGDSTFASNPAVQGWRATMTALYTPAERWKRAGIFSFAGGGNTIANQKAAWDASSLKGAASIRAFLIMVGVNDLAAGTSAATITTALQGFVTDIAMANPGIPIIMAEIAPPGTDLTSGQLTTWTTVNANIAGTGGTPITGITPMTEHLAILGVSTSSPAYSTIKSQYSMGTDPHMNNEGRRVLANVARQHLYTLGLLP